MKSKEDFQYLAGNNNLNEIFNKRITKLEYMRRKLAQRSPRHQKSNMLHQSGFVSEE